MPTYEVYQPSALTFSGNTVTLGAPHDASTNISLLVTDNDAVLNGDSVNDERGNDTNQYGTATYPDGSTLGGPTTRVYSEEQYTLTAPGQPTITVYRVEIAVGNLVGYLPSTPLTPGVTYTFTVANTTDSNDPRYDSIEGALCLTTDSLVMTMFGEKRAGDLKPGDLVKTLHNGFQVLRWIGIRHLDQAALQRTPKLFPVRIAAGALGAGMPTRDLVVSRQHRMLVSSKIAARMFGSSEVLVSAIRLVGVPGIEIDRNAAQVSYVHLLFDRHEIIFAEGAPTESLFLGAQTIATIPPEALEEILTLFPELAKGVSAPPPAVPMPENWQQRRLVQRHAWKRRPLLESYMAA